MCKCVILGKGISGDRGIYTCKASNKFGADVCQAEMVIIDKPHFIKVLQSVQSAGDPATLQCKFSGTKDITAKWFKDGKELTLGPKYKISVTDTVSVLKVLHAEKKDSGEYVFEVHNDVGRSSCSANDEYHHITFENNVATLKLTNVDLSHRGRYTCQAKNESGVEKCFALLFVQGV
uniref:Ig-like domain-containing protein n=1 Tax=Coturnix japonica TaxID=93934 RepID=A0A8C2U2A5_COTJA